MAVHGHLGEEAIQEEARQCAGFQIICLEGLVQNWKTIVVLHQTESQDMVT